MPNFPSFVTPVAPLRTHATGAPLCTRRSRQPHHRHRVALRTSPRAAAQTWRPTRDDVARLTRGEAARVRGTGSRGVPHRLNATEAAAFSRACRTGFLTVAANAAHRRERRGSPLLNSWRMWCDAGAAPTVVLVHADGAEGSEEVWIDRATLRAAGAGDGADGVDVWRRRVDTLVAADALPATDDGSGVAENAVAEEVVDVAVAPTWAIPELWTRYAFDSRAEARAAAARVAASECKSVLSAGVTQKGEMRKRRAPVVHAGDGDEYDDEMDDVMKSLPRF